MKATGTDSARAGILAHLRAAQTSELPPLPGVKAWYAAQQRGEDTAQRVTRLRAALEAVRTEVYDTTEADWPTLLLRLAAQKKVKKFLIGQDTPHGGKLQQLQPAGLELRCYGEPIERWRDELFDTVDASLTLARSAIAELGSLILWPTASEPRLMSLVPGVHFVLLDVATIHSDFHSAIAGEGWQDGLPTNALLICGPSKTADIQQVLAYGAHGPRELVVLLRHPAGEGA